MAKGRIEAALEQARQRSGHKAPARAGSSREAPTARQPSIRAPQFPRVEIDAASCEAARILLAHEQGLRKSANAAGATAYRMLRTRVLQRTRSNDWRIVGVTSPGPGEGKSVTALNLAVAIAREGNSDVFLLDLDMRNPKICTYLGAVPPKEINDYFAGNVAPQDVFFSIGVEHLTLAGTLTPTTDASELLSTGRVEELFRYIREIAPEPLILVDLPPLLSTDDAMIVAPKVDAVLLVFAEGKSRRDGAAKALDLLSEFKLAGIVLNRSHMIVADYYSY